MLNTNHEIMAKPLKLININYNSLIDNNIKRLATIIKQKDKIEIPYTSFAITKTNQLLIDKDEIDAQEHFGLFSPAIFDNSKFFVNLDTDDNNIALNLLLAYTTILKKYYLIEQYATNMELNKISSDYYLFTPINYVNWIIGQPAEIGNSKEGTNTSYAATVLPYFAKALLTLPNLDELLYQTHFIASIVYTFYIANDIDYFPISQWFSDIYLKTLITKINQRMANLDKPPLDETVSLWNNCMAWYRK